MLGDVQQVAQDRLNRIEAAINLQKPDRVPLWGFGGDIIASHYGITQYDFCYDSEKTVGAVAKFLRDFPSDMGMAGLAGLDGRVFSLAFLEAPDISPGAAFVTGPMHDALGDKYYRYPGREIAEDAPPQFVGGTFMEVEEYDDLIEDPIGFIAETVLPRACSQLASPQLAARAWVRFGMALMEGGFTAARIGEISAKLGYPYMPMGWGYAPMDIIGDFLRGFDTILLDILRYPDKVKKAVEALTEPVTQYALNTVKNGAKLAFFPLHLNEYLSPEMYKEFYWPSLKKLILRLHHEGIKSIVFFEGNHEAHLETILELPKGWGVAYFEKTNILKAREKLLGHTCVMGGIPMGLVVSGTAPEIEVYIKDLLEEVKAGGAFILAPGVGNAPAKTPPENIRAVIEAVEKYG